MPASERVRQYARIEFQIDGLPEYADPFDPAVVDLRVEFAAPDGKRVTVPAFFIQDYERRREGGRDWIYPAGKAGWRARFAPTLLGEYRAEAVLKDQAGERRSKVVRFGCTAWEKQDDRALPSAATRHGFVRVAKRDPRFFELDDGSPFFAIGQNLAFIGEQQYVTLSKAEDIFGKLSENGANYLRVWTCADDWATAIEARKSAWGRSWSGRGSFVADPEESARKCLRLTASNTVQAIEPSHPVALRANTKYVFAARVRMQGEGAASVEVHGSNARVAALGTPRPSTAPNPPQILRCEFTTGPRDYWLGPARLRFEGSGSVLISDVSLKEDAGATELLWEANMNTPTRGYFNPLDCFLLDELVRAAEQNGIYLQLCMLTRDLYMNAVTNVASTNYSRAISDARKFFRYAIARWGCSTSVAAWEYWNEMNPGLPTDRFYSELGTFFEQNDPYHHLRTTSTWGPSAKDCRHPKLDVADVHFYLRPADNGRLANEVDAVIERTHWLREQAPNKPAHLGEFGLADNQWRITDDMKRSADISDVHNALWASALSGASGTAMYWWWERIDQRHGYEYYKALSRFISDLPWNGGMIEPIVASCSDPAIRVIGLRAGKEAWIWLFDPAAAWAKVAVQKETPPERSGLSLRIERFPAAAVAWIDTHSGATVSEGAGQSEGDTLRVAVPTFKSDVACRLK